MPHYVAHPRRIDHSRSQMSPDAKKIKRLLYVSDWTTNDVYVYDYKTGKSAGKLTGFNEPYGQCVDGKGDVWITNWGANTVVEYAHGGTDPLQTLSTDSEPAGCAIDPTTGNLAVDSFQGGALDIFASPSWQKHSYWSDLCYPSWPPGYDDKGNVFFQALWGGSARPDFSDPLTCELPHGGTSINTVNYYGFSINFAGAIVWDGKHLALVDQEYDGVYQTGLYQVSDDGSGNFTAIGQTKLSDDCDGDYVDVVQPFIIGTKNTPANKKQGTSVVGSNLWCYDEGTGKVDFWAYPMGGSPASDLANPPAQPYGQSVSIAR